MTTSNNLHIDIGNMFGNMLGTWRAHRELDGNTLWTKISKQSNTLSIGPFMLGKKNCVIYLYVSVNDFIINISSQLFYHNEMFN
jgi:hypothetical protein